MERQKYREADELGTPAQKVVAGAEFGPCMVAGLADKASRLAQADLSEGVTEYRPMPHSEVPAVGLVAAGETAIVYADREARSLAGFGHGELSRSIMDVALPGERAELRTVVLQCLGRGCLAHPHVFGYQSSSGAEGWAIIAAEPIMWCGRRVVACILLPPAYGAPAVGETGEDKCIPGNGESVEGMLLSILGSDLRETLTEIRTVLNSLMLGAGGLRGRRSLRLVQDGLSGTEEALGMLDTLEQWNRAQLGLTHGVVSEVPLYQPIRSVVESFRISAANRGIELTWRASRALTARVDTAQLSEALRNLVSNGLKYTPSGGSVAVTAKADETHAYICVEDSGVGMPEEMGCADMPVLERRRRGERGERGIGVGLALCSRIAQNHGGGLTVGPRKGGGSAVTVTLPLCDDAKRSTKQR